MMLAALPQLMNDVLAVSIDQASETDIGIGLIASLFFLATLRLTYTQASQIISVTIILAQGLGAN